MKSEEERRKHTLVVVAIVGGGGLVLLVLARGAHATAGAPPSAAHVRETRATTRPAKKQPSTQKLNWEPNPGNASLEESLIAARAAALNTYDQSAVAELGANDQYRLGVNQDTTNQAIAFNTNAAQLKETGMTTNAYEAIAEREAAAQEAAAQAQAQAYESVGSQYAQAQQTQAQGGFWGSILGGIGSLLPFLGFSGMTGSGTGYVDASGDPYDPFASSYAPETVDPMAYAAMENVDTVPPVQVPENVYP